MGIIASLFGKKNRDRIKDSTPTEPVNIIETKKESPSSSPSLHLKGKPDSNGLYPSELVMLAVAEKHKTDEVNFYQSFLDTYEIANPAKMLKSLHSRGYIEVSDAKSGLAQLKLAELKEIAASLGVEVKGKKADIIARLSEEDDDSLSQYVKERTWKLTESGQKALAANPYILYFLEEHPYSVRTVGVDIWTVNKEFVDDPKRPYRDIIYRQLNEQMNNASIAFQTERYHGDNNTRKYCECYRLMALFIEEEGKSYINAADLYFQYIFKNINIHAGLRLINQYLLFKNDKKYQAEAINEYYNDIKIYPFQRTELLRLIDVLDIEGDAVREALIRSFKRAKDNGIMTEQETADFVIFELNGDDDKSRALADRLAKKAVKKIK